jgi:hypothetical protein
MRVLWIKDSISLASSRKNTHMPFELIFFDYVFFLTLGTSLILTKRLMENIKCDFIIVNQGHLAPAALTRPAAVYGLA